MKISDINVKIKIVKKIIQKDEIGQDRQVLQYILTLSAYPSYEGGGERNFVGMELDDGQISFTIRYRKALKDICADEYLIVFKDRAYDIKSIDNFNYKNRYIKFRCKKVEL